MRLPLLISILHSLTDQAIAQINLGTAAPFGVIAGAAIANTGETVVTGNLGIYPNTESSITGFPPGRSDTVYAANGRAQQALNDAQTAYNSAASLATTATIGSELGGQTLGPGTFKSASSVGITGQLTLDGQNKADSLFVFQIGSTLTTASASSVVLINGAQACNVFFQVGSSATLGTTTVFNGNILALASITLNNGVIINGGLYALNGRVDLINDQVKAQTQCVIESTTTTSVASSSTIIPTTVDEVTPTASAVDVPVIEITPASTVDVPVIEITPASTVDVPVIEITPASTVDVPVIEITPASTVDVPVIEITPASTVDVPVIEITPASTVDVPVIEITPASTVDVPAIEITPASTVDDPVIETTTASIVDDLIIGNTTKIIDGGLTSTLSGTKITTTNTTVVPTVFSTNLGSQNLRPTLLRYVSNLPESPKLLIDHALSR
jgi:hypothetical protein